MLGESALEGWRLSAVVNERVIGVFRWLVGPAGQSRREENASRHGFRNEAVPTEPQVFR